MAFSIHVTLKAKARSGLAILVVDEDDNEVWIPESQIDADSEIWSFTDIGTQGKLVIPEWLAKKKGWDP